MKSQIEEGNQIPEMYVNRHKHDIVLNDGFNYVDNMVSKSVSPLLYKNDTNASFLGYLNKMIVTMTESILPARNIFFWSVPKHFNSHGR